MSFLGVLHLLDGVLLGDGVQPGIAPVLAHLAVQEVLADGGQLQLEAIVQDGDHILVPLHESVSS
jgi:hypothetical protein